MFRRTIKPHVAGMTRKAHFCLPATFFCLRKNKCAKQSPMTGKVKTLSSAISDDLCTTGLCDSLCYGCMSEAP